MNATTTRPPTATARQFAKATVTVDAIGLNPTREERRTFDVAHDVLKQGWSGTFDQLAAYMA